MKGQKMSKTRNSHNADDLKQGQETATENNKEIKEPAELLKLSFRELAQDAVDKKIITFKKPKMIEIGDTANWNSIRNDVIITEKAIYEYGLRDSELQVKMILNAGIHSLRKIKTVSNNGSPDQTKATMEVVFKTQNGGLTSSLVWEGMAKVRSLEFSKALAEISNQLIFQGTDRTIRLIRDYINKHHDETINLLPSSGEIGLNGKEGRVYVNGFANKDGFVPADKDGIIPIEKGKSYKLNNSQGTQMPYMFTDEVDVKAATHKLLSSMDKAFGGKIEPLLGLGLGIMGMFCKNIWRDTSGFPTGFLYGASKQGKSTIQNIINYIYGFDERFLALGNSTARSINLKKNLYNGCVIHLNDVSSKILMKESFENNVIESYEQGLREKLKNGSEFNNLQQNSVMFISSNYLPIQKEKMLNRILPISFTPNMYNHTQMLDYYQKPYYLSTIMLELLKFDWNTILTTIKAFDEWIAKNAQVSASRESSNTAIAYTGLILLQQIGDYKLENQEQKLLNYFEWYQEQFQELEDPVDSFINHLAHMLKEYILIPEEHLWVEKKDGTTRLTISTSACLHKFNCFIGKVYHDKFVHPKEFAEAVKNSNYLIEKKNVRYKLPKYLKCSPIANSYILDISLSPNSETIYWAYKQKLEELKNSKEKSE